jgi:hypothetical protein
MLSKKVSSQSALHAARRTIALFPSNHPTPHPSGFLLAYSENIGKLLVALSLSLQLIANKSHITLNYHEYISILAHDLAKDYTKPPV